MKTRRGASGLRWQGNLYFRQVCDLPPINNPALKGRGMLFFVFLLYKKRQNTKDKTWSAAK
jgi:hypothetical protein